MLRDPAFIWPPVPAPTGKYMQHSRNAVAEFDDLAVKSIISYQMVYLLNRELSFDVDLSTVGCGLNAAFFFVAMEADGGTKRYGYKGPVYGTGYCDAQLASTNKPTCHELDIIESNSLTTLLATHTCNASQYCEPTGCGFMPYPLGQTKFYGRGRTFTVDTTKPFTVVTRFVTVDGKDTGNLKEIQRFYKQNGRIIPNPTVIIYVFK